MPEEQFPDLIMNIISRKLDQRVHVFIHDGELSHYTKMAEKYGRELSGVYRSYITQVDHITVNKISVYKITVIHGSDEKFSYQYIPHSAIDKWTLQKIGGELVLLRLGVSNG